MKKLLGIVVLGLLFSSNAYSLNNCLGDDPISWTNCIGSYNYPDKKYTGEWVNGKREGQGISILNDGSSYEGEWKKNLPNGQGIMKIPYDYYSVKFIGKWNNGVPNGQGIIKCFPEGQKNNSKFNTKKYKGEWIDGFLKIKNDDGNKVYVSSETCAIYTGKLKKGGADGKGKMIFPHGKKYIGVWKNDNFIKGTAIYYNGVEYTGEFKNNLPEGKGTMIDADGNKFIGQFKNGYPKKATQIFLDGSKYIGEWKNGKAHGQGEMIYADGAKYVGQWSNSEKHGQGTYTTKDGTTYFGEWKNHMLNGDIIITFPDGKIVERFLKDGKIIEEFKDL